MRILINSIIVILCIFTIGNGYILINGDAPLRRNRNINYKITTEFMPIEFMNLVDGIKVNKCKVTAFLPLNQNNNQIIQLNNGSLYHGSDLVKLLTGTKSILGPIDWYKYDKFNIDLMSSSNLNEQINKLLLNQIDCIVIQNKIDSTFIAQYKLNTEYSYNALNDLLISQKNLINYFNVLEFVFKNEYYTLIKI